MVTRQDIEDYLEYCFYQGNKNATRLTKLIALHIPRPMIRRGRVQKLAKKEILKIFSKINIQTNIGVRDASILILAAFGGLRIGEITGLNMADIIDDGESLDISVVGKFSACRTVSLWKAPAMFIRRWYVTRISQGAGNGSPFFVSFKRGDTATAHRITPVGVSMKIKAYTAMAGINRPTVSMHMFRATHISDLRHIKRYDVFSIGDRVGHRSVATTAIYVTSRERIKREYASLSAYWSEFNHAWDGV